MEIKFTKHFLAKLENLFAESDFILRYEKGTFQSGYCVLNSNKLIMVNNYYPLEGKITTLIEIIKNVPLSDQNMSVKNKKLLAELKQKTLDF